MTKGRAVQEAQEITSFSTPSGEILHAEFWLGKAPARATVIVMHGVAGHGGRYQHVLQHLRARGYHGIIYDQRGHGRSTGRRGHIDSFDDYARDLALVVARARTLKLPVHLIACGMGALSALHYLFERPKFSGITAVALLGVPILPLVQPARVQEISSKVWGRFFPVLSLPALARRQNIPADEQIVASFESDPLVLRRLTAGWYAAFLKIVEHLRQINPFAFNDLDVPAYFLHGGQDPIADPEGSREMFSRYPTLRKRLSILWDSTHELLNQKGFETILDDITQWFDESVGYERVQPWLGSDASQKLNRPPRGL